MTRSISSSGTGQPWASGSSCFFSGFVSCSISHRLLFFWPLGLLKNRLPPPPSQDMGGGEGKAGVLGVRARKEPKRNGVQKQRRPHLAFVPASFAGAKVAVARVAVDEDKALLRLGTDSRNFPSSKVRKLPDLMSALWECF